MKNYLFRLSLLCLTMVGIFSAAETNRAQETRDIVPVFEDSRPPAQATANGGKLNSGGKITNNGGKINNVAVNGRDKNKPSYQRINSRINSGKISNSDRPKPSAQAGKKPPVAVSAQTARQIGVTIWRLEEVRATTDDIETFADNGAQKRLLAPSRVSTETLFASGELVRLGFEVSRRGYLYVINQEMFTDGSLGAANLIFPNKRIRNGANLLTAGRPIELPDAKGNPFYFELRQTSGNGKKLAAEVLTVIVADRPLPLKIGDRPLAIDAATIQKWRTKWAGNVEVFEPKNASSRYTKSEREAGEGRRTLTRGDALPQTVFLVEANRNGGSLITVPLWYEN